MNIKQTKYIEILNDRRDFLSLYRVTNNSINTTNNNIIKTLHLVKAHTSNSNAVIYFVLVNKVL